MLTLPDVRRKLDRLNKQIISRLADRSRFAHSSLIYDANGIRVQGGAAVSFLDHALRGLEVYHATLGRYSYPDQFPLHADVSRAAPVQRVVQMERLPAVDYPIQQHVQDFYVALLPDICASGDDPHSYGETAYVDADAIMLIHERINLGRYVAQAKARQSPDLLSGAHSPQRLRAQLVDLVREQAVIDSVRRQAEGHDLDPHTLARAFQWIMDETTGVQVAFLQMNSRQ